MPIPNPMYSKTWFSLHLKGLKECTGCSQANAPLVSVETKWLYWVATVLSEISLSIKGFRMEKSTWTCLHACILTISDMKFTPYNFSNSLAIMNTEKWNTEPSWLKMRIIYAIYNIPRYIIITICSTKIFTLHILHTHIHIPFLIAEKQPCLKMVFEALLQMLC